jgi:metal-sulfur cluster biosynthetic enzyme
MGDMPTRDQVTEALRSVIDPELRRDIVELKMVRSIDIHDNGVVDVMVSLAARFEATSRPVSHSRCASSTASRR